MKLYINKSILCAGLLALTSFSSCMQETDVTEYATQKQVNNSANAAHYLLMGIPAYLNAALTDVENHYEFGYGAMMHIRDVETGDAPYTFSDYGIWFESWLCNKNIGQDYSVARYPWKYYYALIQKANNVLGALDETTATKEQLGYLGAAHAFRAMAYLDIAPMYEFLPNEKNTTGKNSDGNDVMGLTVPIVTEKTTLTEARNNPRAKKADMVEFILSDLQIAEKYIPYLTVESKTFPHMAEIYGLEARLYMWQEDYVKAKEFARKAINATDCVPMTESQCLNTRTGFNTLSPWMWGSQQTSEDRTVTSGIINWTSFMSNEQDFGYASAGVSSMIDKSMYDRISNTDFRKLEFVAPEGSPLASKIQFVNKKYSDLPAYFSLKFRPNEGAYNASKTAAASAYPLMRVEEMYFIEAEAAAHENPAEGKQLLESFMKNYRDAEYSCTVSSKDDVIEEIVFQKRVELWGEGRTFYDIKRLNYSVTRGYEGTNYYSTSRFNTNGRPAWMNFVFHRSEAENNTALRGYNNPDPSKCYTPWVEKE